MVPPEDRPENASGDRQRDEQYPAERPEHEQRADREPDHREDAFPDLQPERCRIECGGRRLNDAEQAHGSDREVPEPIGQARSARVS